MRDSGALWMKAYYQRSRHPDFRRRGIGEALVSVLLSHTVANGIKAIRWKSGHPINGQSLYSKFGLCSAGLRKIYLKTTEKKL
jgi:ribosomal protein S18 acetylase RimI-like enzyme